MATVTTSETASLLEPVIGATGSSGAKPKSVPCAHCGAPSPLSLDSGPSFCCQGCAGAYAMIQGWGLDDYYALRARLSQAPARSVNQATGAELLEDLAAAGVPVQDVGQGLSSVVLAVDGLHCGACAWLIERCPPLVDGWQAARVQMSDHTVRLIYDAQRTSPSKLARVLGKIGYNLAPLSQDEDASDQRFQQLNRRHLVQIAIAGFCAMNAMWIAVALYAGEFSGMAAEQAWILRWAGVWLGIAATVIPGHVFFRGAWAALRTRTPHMDVPLALGLGAGTIGSLVSGWRGSGDVYFDSLATLVFLLLVGRWIQFRQQRRAGQAVSLLMRLSPNVAQRIQADGTTQTVPVSRLNAGDCVAVRAGDAIPADGKIVAGETLLNRALLTGESEPVTATVGDEVAAGTVNLLSPITVAVEAVGRESRVGRLMQVIEEAVNRQTPIVQLADRASGRFIKLILVLAVVTLLAWWSHGAEVALGHTVALLIVACPCALALATPLSIAVALGRAARRKILIRSGDVFERMARPGMLWLDKTGTLTTGRMQVQSWSGDDRALAAVAGIEQSSTHPIATAITEYARLQRVQPERAEGVTQSTGGGIVGDVQAKRVVIGSQKFLIDQHQEIPTDVAATVAAIIERSCTPVIVAIEGVAVGAFAIADTIRADAKATVRELNEQGWCVGILSGDHPEIVQRVAEELAIPRQRAFGAMTPEDKVQVIEASRKEQQGRGCIVMVGDGVNDAAALAAADVGVATRGGAEVSLRAAPVFLGEDGLRGLTLLSTAARRTLTAIRRGFSVSLCYNLFAVSLAVFGKINPLIAAIIMPISSLTVVTLALTTRTFPSIEEAVSE